MKKYISYSFGCSRDAELSIMSALSIQKYTGGNHFIFIEGKDFPVYEKITPPNLKLCLRPNGFGNGSGWEASMIKLNILRYQMANAEYADGVKMNDKDIIIYADSDCFLISDLIFKKLEDCDFQGLEHKPYYNTKLGEFGHISGCMNFMSVRFSKMLSTLTDDALSEIRNEFKEFTVTENEDVLMSYLIKCIGGRLNGINSEIMNPKNIEDVLSNIKDYKDKNSVVHLNYPMTSFMDSPLTGKWDVPRILKEKGIYETICYN